MSVTTAIAEVPLDRVVALPDTEADVLAPAIARDHHGLAVVVFRGSRPVATAGEFVRAVLDDLEQTAVELLPGWLPDATAIERPDAGGLTALRMVAAARARSGRYPTSFLTALALLAVTGHRPAPDGLPIESRVAALTRVVAEAFGRPQVVLLVPVQRIAAERRPFVAAGAEWLVHHGGPAVWLLGSGSEALERVPTVRPVLPTIPAAPAVIGRPHPASAVEATLEAALAAEDWAGGRRWNQPYQAGPLAAPVRLDLVWPAERCAVELDGPEHCRPERFEEDRRRDVLLQLDGYAVLRFTNARVTHDVGTVVHQIGTYLRGRRREMTEGRANGRR